MGKKILVVACLLPFLAVILYMVGVWIITVVWPLTIVVCFTSFLSTIYKIVRLYKGKSNGKSVPKPARKLVNFRKFFG
jgi:hypothetical protein